MHSKTNKTTKVTHDCEILGGPFIVKDFKFPEKDFCYNNTELLLDIKTSTIPNSGRGLFSAERLIKAGDLIGWYDGPVLCDSDKITDYSFTLDDIWFVDGLHYPRCYIAMVNDPFGTDIEPNCEFNLMTHHQKTGKLLPGKEKRVFLKAITDIKKGEELFASYGEEYWNCESRKKYLKKSSKKKTSTKTTKTTKTSSKKTKKVVEEVEEEDEEVEEDEDS